MINKIEKNDLNCNVFSVYDYNGLSMQELLSQFFTKINECIDVSNESKTFLEWLKVFGVKDEIIKLINEMNSNGTMATIINEQLFNELNNKINNVDARVHENVYPSITFLQPPPNHAGDCSVIKLTNGNFIMIDCGEEGAYLHIEEQLTALKCYSIDKLFITHSHSDHIGNAVQIIEKYRPKQLYCRTVSWEALPSIEIEWRTKELHNAMINKAREVDCEIIEVTDQDIQLTNEEVIRIIGTDYINYSDYNHMSIAYQYNYRNLAKCLFAGDMTNETEKHVMARYGTSLQSDLLKLGHHGTNSSSHLNFLATVKPRICIGSTYADKPIADGIEVTKRCYWVGAKVYDVWDTNQGGTLSIIGKHFTHALNEVNVANKFLFVNDKWGYIKANGNLANYEIICHNGEFYYIDEFYYMRESGFIEIHNGAWLYADSNGVLYRDKWLNHTDGEWYYFLNNCRMIANDSKKINGVVYTFDHLGRCTNPQDLDGTI